MGSKTSPLYAFRLHSQWEYVKQSGQAMTLKQNMNVTYQTTDSRMWCETDSLIRAIKDNKLRFE